MNERMLKLAETLLNKLEKLPDLPADSQLESYRKQIDLLWQVVAITKELKETKVTNG